MNRRKEVVTYYSKISNSNLAEKLAVGLVEKMKSSRFGEDMITHRYLALMHNGKFLFRNDLSFYDTGLPVFKTSELKTAIEKGRIGELIRKASNELSKRNKGINAFKSI